MKRNDIFSGLALLASLFTLFIVLSILFKTVDETESLELIRQQMNEKNESSTQAIRTELVERLDVILTSLGLTELDASPEDTIVAALENTDLKALVRQAKSDPEVARLLRTGIESIILKEMAAELENVDWLDTLSQKKIQQLLTRAAQTSLNKGFGNFQSPVDVSEIAGTGEKINRILEEFEGVNSYSHNNALVKQIAEMGEEAIDPLISRLTETGTGHNWAMKMAITDSLEKLLTEEHEELILAEFTKNGNFPKLIEKYQFPAAEDEVMNKILHPLHGRVDQHVVNAALKMNTERSYPLLLDYMSHGQNVSYTASQLAAEGIDITEPLRMASSRANNTWEKASLVELCLERDMPEGYDLAIQVLRANEMHAEHSQEKVYQYIRKYTGISGTYDEVADWLQENHPN